MKSFASKVIINAAPERVWAVLTEGERYAAWSGPVSKLEGRIVQGETLAVHVKMNPGKAFPVMPIFARMIPDLQPVFDDFARDLKHEAERVA